MKNLKVSNRAQNVISSPIRKFLPFMRKTEEAGIKVYKVNVGDPDLQVPNVFLDEVKKYNQKTLGYAPSPGIAPHVVAWQKYYRQFGVDLPAANIIPTVGCAEAIMLALQAVADSGDEVIVFEPLYVSYKSFAVMTGINLVPITLPIENDFAMPDASVIESKISNRTKAIVIINPDNPTGKLWSKEELDVLVDIAKRHNLFIISDETYREIRFAGESFCLLSNPEARQNTILVDSCSKRFSMPGARIGCMASFNEEVMQSLLKFAQARLSAPTLEQFGTIPLLENSRSYTDMVQKEYLKRRDTVSEGLKEIPGVVFKPAQGAFYQAVKLPIAGAEDFVKFMISEFNYEKQTVMVTPMQDFYITPGLGKNEIRIAYVLNSEDLKKAMHILKLGLEAYNAKNKK
jgi:aspartate aminotransferase